MTTSNTSSHSTSATPSSTSPLPSELSRSGSIEILSPGPLSLLQDQGRLGLAASGVTASGSFDRLSAARANHAVGNSPGVGLIEVLSGGLEFRSQVSTSIIVTGAQSHITIDGRTWSANTILDLAPGNHVVIEHAGYGLRAYVALRGGVGSQQQVLGSVSSDTLSGIGPAPLAAGQVLDVGGFPVDPEWWPQLRHIPNPWPPRSREELHVHLGPRSEWFRNESVLAFLSQEYVVTPQSNRIGVRLEGAQPLERAIPDELPSEGMVRGAIQVPPNGQPVIFGPDHPVTGGYPVIATLSARSCDRLAQLAPGTRVRFALARR